MKSKLLIISVCLLCLVGCGKKDNTKVVNELAKKINNLSAYNLKGNLEIINGEDSYMYEIESSYEKEDMFKVSLKNTNNNHIQILLKNSEGVYVLTPSLNKSFKFQSDWPYNNSQIYLYQTIIKDIENDKNHTVESGENDGYIINSMVNYSNNKELTKQKVYVDKNMNINKVEVLDDNDSTQMIMNFISIDLKPTFDDNYFDLNTCLNTSKIDETAKEVSKLDTIIYPLYLPLNTHLSSQNIINKNDGERVIMTFDGDSSFMLIEETTKKSDQFETIPVFGEPVHISDSLGVVSDKTVNWYSNGVEYYLTSSDLSETELINIANSINVLPVGK